MDIKALLNIQINSYCFLELIYMNILQSQNSNKVFNSPHTSNTTHETRKK